MRILPYVMVSVASVLATGCCGDDPPPQEWMSRGRYVAEAAGEVRLQGSTPLYCETPPADCDAPLECCDYAVGESSGECRVRGTGDQRQGSDAMPTWLVIECLWAHFVVPLPDLRDAPEVTVLDLPLVPSVEPFHEADHVSEALVLNGVSAASCEVETPAVPVRLHGTLEVLSRRGGRGEGGQPVGQDFQVRARVEVHSEPFGCWQGLDARVEFAQSYGEYQIADATNHCA